MTPRDTVGYHRTAVEFLEHELAKPFGGSTVVISHHAPHPRSVDPAFAADPSSVAYASDLCELIRVFRPAIWVHGHVHRSADYIVERTRIICNPRG